MTTKQTKNNSISRKVPYGACAERMLSTRDGLTCLSLFIVLLLPLITLADNYNLWTYNTKVYLNTTSGGADVSGDVYKFPVLIRLTSSNFTFAQAKTNGEDIRFAKSSGGHLPYEIESWSSGAQTASLWVLVDTVYGNNELQYIKMYWGKSDAADSSAKNSVFATSNNFVGVWHLNSNATDATANSNNGTVSQAVAGACMIENGYDFDGVDDYINIPTSASLNALSNMTASAWVKTEDGAQLSQTFISFYSSATDRTYISNWDATYGVMAYDDLDDHNTYAISSGSMLTVSQWYHVAWVINGANWVLYLNGQYVTATNNTYTMQRLNDGFSTRFGRRAGSNDAPFDGDMDEIRISNAERSASWIKLCYQNQQATQTLVEMGIEKYDEWTYNKKIYINTTATGANVSGNVTNFPLLIRLNSGDFSFYQAQTNGEDIRFAGSDGTHYSYEVERWDNTSDSVEIWVKIPTVYGNNATQYLNMYWGNSNAADSSKPSNVFQTSNGFQGVWHLAENDFTDATTNANNGTNSSSANAGGAVGDGKSFTPNSFITISSAADNTNVTTGTFYAWVNMNSSIIADGAAYGVVEIGDASSNNDNIALRKTTGNTLVFRYRQGGTSYNATITDISGYGNTWKHIAGVWDASNIYIYENGSLIAGPVARGVDITLANLDQAFIGSEAQGAQGLYFNGLIDETRISSTNRSADWIKLCYETQKPNSSTSGEENYNDWSYSRNTYINTTASGADVSDDVLDFPLLIRLSASNFNFSQAETNGADIRFAKADGIHLSYEIERWSDALDSAEIWVQVDTIYGNNSTQYIKMYWGKSAAVDRSDGTEVYSSDAYFQGVWHLDEEQAGTGTADVYQDATANNLDGDDYISTTSQIGVTGLGHDFDGTDDYITFGDIADKASGTISLWFSPDATFNSSSATTQGLYGKYQSDTYNVTVALRGTDYGSTGGEGGSGCIHTKIEYNGTILHMSSSTTTWTGGAWYHVVLAWNGVKGRVFINGVLERERDVTLPMGNSGADRIGGNQFDAGNITGGPTLYFNGKLDEFRMESAYRSASWIKLCFETQKRNSDAMTQPIVWDGEGSDNKFSTAANWVGDVTPSSTNDIIFNNTSTKACSLDISTTVDDITFSSGYTGTFKFGDDTLHATGNVNFSTGGSINAGTGALEFTGTSAQAFTPKAGRTFPEIIQNGSGGTTISTNALTANAIMVTSGTFDLGDAGLTHSAASLGSSAATLDFGTSTLQITSGNADFSSLSTLTAGTGTLAFTHASNTQVLTPKLGATHPNITHTGGGTLQLAGNNVIASSFSQTAGILDFNSRNLQTTGNFSITTGTSSSFTGLASRTITVGGNAILSGQSSNLLDLNTASTWHYWTVTGNLTASYADINYSNASGSTANGQAASTCTDGGTNNSWTFDTEDYPNDWTYTKNVYINTTPTGADISSDITDFPLLMRLDATNFTFGEAETDGRDIRFARSDGISLSYEIEEWDNINQIASIWVLMNTITGNSKSQYFKMYWGNNSVATKSDPTKVFQTTNNYTAAWHLHDDFLDATTNNHDGTNTGSTDLNNSIIGDGQSFDGNDDINCGSWTKSSTFTISCWVTFSTYSQATYAGIVFGGTTDNSWGLAANYDAGSLYTRVTDGTATRQNWVLNTLNTTNYPSGWNYVVFQANGSNLYYYTNGTLYGSTAQTVQNTGSENLYIGRFGTYAGYFQGYIDEVRYCSVVRSADWIKLCYETQKSGSAVVYFSEAPIVTGLSGSGLVSSSQNDTDTVVVQYEVEDPNDATVTINLDYQLEGDVWTNTSNISGDAGAGIDANNANTDRTIKWNARADVGSNVEDNYYVRVWAQDAATNKDTTESAIFSIDTKKPSGLANFEADDTTSSTIVLTWTPATDGNFSHYEIWYGTTQADVQNRQGTAAEWDYDDDGSLTNATTATTTITSLSTNTTYYLKIWAIDSMINEATVADIAVPTRDMAAPVWSKTTVGIVKGGAINDGNSTIYVGSGASTERLACFSLNDGSTKWSYSTSSYGACKMPTYSYAGGSYKVVASAGNYVIGRQDNGTSSSELFAPINFGSTAGNPYVSPDDASFYVVYSGNLTKRNLTTGAEVWTAAVANATPDADIVVWNDVIYLACTDGTIHKRNASDGSPNQTYDAQDDVDLPLLVQDSVLYITPANDTAYSIDATNLTTENWKLYLGMDNTGAAFIEARSNNLYLATTDSVKKVNASAGTRAWAFYTSDTVSSGPIPYGSYVYFGCNNGDYYSVTSSGGSVTKWPYTETSGSANSGPWIDIGGKVIFGTTGGNLDAFSLLRGTPAVKTEIMTIDDTKNNHKAKLTPGNKAVKGL